MTANELFETAVTLMFGTTEDKEDYYPLFINTLNLLLSENLEINNAIREACGKNSLEAFPKITEMSDNLPCEDAILSFLPYGCAGYIYTDDDKNIGADYKNKYETERNKVIRADYTEI